MLNHTVYRRSLAALITCVALVWSGVASADVPVTLTHQGRLLDDSGEPMTGTVRLQFSIHTSKTKDAMVWNSKTMQKDLGDSGFYSVVLGKNNPLDSSTLKTDKDLWIQLTVIKGNNSRTLEPRLKLHSVPYAVRAGLAESVAEGAVGNKAISEVDWKKVQNKPSFPKTGQACQGERVVSEIDSQGNIQCKPDSNTMYQAGAGLLLQNQTFKLKNQACPSNEVAVGIDTSGSLKCVPDQNTQTTYDKNCPPGEVIGQLTRNGSAVCVKDQTSSYSGGQGINVNNQSIEADFSDVQKRVTGSCSGDKFITGINQDGSVNCSSPSSGGSVGGGCQKLYKASTCPANDNDGVNCADAPKGSFCEYDSGNNCNDGNTTADNCGFYDWYFKAE